MSGNRDTYQKLIDAASDCFADKGFAASSVKDIASRAGISQGSMYTYFASKDDLIVAIVLEEQRIALSTYDREYTGSNLERICEIFRSCVSNEPYYPANHNTLWVEIMAESSRNDVVREHFIKSDVVMRKGIEKFILRGIDAGEFRQNLKLEDITIILFAMLDGLMARKAINPAFAIENDIPDFPDVLHAIMS